MCSKQVGLYNSKDYTGRTTFGGFSNKLRVDSRFVFPIPSEIPSEAAAPLFCAGFFFKLKFC
jgi:D-arabinose 1-dehydrogenase-like Zn-dependent alcohol dehydrogenase